MDLIGIYQNDSESEGSKASESDLEVPAFVDKNEVVNWDGMEDRDCYITIKIVPEVFVVEPSISSDPADENYTLYFYRLHAETMGDQPIATAGAAAEELLNSVATINSIGITLKSQLSSDVVNTISELYLLDVTLSLRIIYLGSKSVPISDITQMQRFHNALYCQEDSSAFSVKEFLGMEFDFLAQAAGNCNITPFSFMSDEKWSTSSNGSWFVVYPIEHNAMDTSVTESFDCYDAEYLKKSANEAQVLIHNLRITSQTDTTVAQNIPVELSCGALSQNQWNGLVILANDMSLCFVAADTPRNRKTLNSVMKRVKVAPPPPTSTVAMSADEDNITAEKSGGGYSDISSGQEDFDNSIVFPPTTAVVTYAEYLKSKRPHLAEIVERHSQDPSHRLIAANQISTKATHTLMLSTISDQIKCSSEWARRNSVFRPKAEKLHFLAEQCRPIGKLRWFHMTRLLPSVMYRVVSLQLAVECRALMRSKIEAAKASAALDEEAAPAGKPAVVVEVKVATSQSPSPSPPHPETPQCELPPDQRTRDRITLPEPDYDTVPRIATMLEAMTPKMAIEHMDSERYNLQFTKHVNMQLYLERTILFTNTAN